MEVIDYNLCFPKAFQTLHCKKPDITRACADYEDLAFQTSTLNNFIISVQEKEIASVIRPRNDKLRNFATCLSLREVRRRRTTWQSHLNKINTPTLFYDI